MILQLLFFIKKTYYKNLLNSICYVINILNMKQEKKMKDSYVFSNLIEDARNQNYNEYN